MAPRCNRRRNGWVRGASLCLVLGLAASALLGLSPEWAEARAGGGDRYGGSSSSSGSSSGSGSSSSSSGSRSGLSIPPSGSIFGSQSGETPADLQPSTTVIAIGAGVVLALLLLAGVCVLLDKCKQNEERVIRKGQQVRADFAREKALKKLVGRKAGFDEAVFLKRARVAFRRLQSAWVQQDIRPVQHFLSDGVLERFTLQLRALQDRGIRNRVENLQILSATMEQLDSGQAFDTVTVKFLAEAVDYSVNARTGEFAGGSREGAAFTEYWSFVRRPGAEMKWADGLLEGNCPNCGTALTVSVSAKCESCGSLIKSGAYDWVLAEITQESEWERGEALDVPGVAQLQLADPGFCVQHVEDRGSVMFWRHIEALRIGSIGPLRKVASQEFCDGFAERFQPNEKGDRYCFDDVAVGGVKTLGVAAGLEWDCVMVKVRWSAVHVALAPNAKSGLRTGASLYTHCFILKRRHGVKSELNNALASAHCPSCGAPETENQSHACTYCGAVLNDGGKDWVLDGIEFPYSERVRALEAQMRQPAVPDVPPESAAASLPVASAPLSGGLEAVAWMMNVMMADKQIDPKERRLVLDYAEARHVPKREVEKLFGQAERWGKVDAPEPRTRQEAKAWLAAMAAMALQNGSVSPEEYQMLLQGGKRMGFDSPDIKLIVNATRKRLYEEARATLQRVKVAR